MTGMEELILDHCPSMAIAATFMTARLRLSEVQGFALCGRIR
jgi:hypothetical protein